MTYNGIGYEVGALPWDWYMREALKQVVQSEIREVGSPRPQARLSQDGRSPGARGVNAPEVAGRFLQHVSRDEWEEALALTQISWRYGFDPRTSPGWLGRIVQAVFPAQRPTETNGVDELRPLIEPYRIRRVRGVAYAQKISPVYCTVFVKTHRLAVGRASRMLTQTVFNLTMVKESGPYRPDPEGTWGFNPVSIRHARDTEPSVRFRPVEVDTEE